MNNDNNIRKEVTKGKVFVSRVYKASFQKNNTLTAEVKQVITTESFYPNQSISSDMQDNPFSYREFGLEEKDFINKETRVAWFDVPMGSTKESVEAKLPEDANLYKVMSNKPIVTRNQLYGIDTGLITMDTLANKQLTRYGKNHPNAGNVIFDKYGKIQYRAIFYKSNIIQDEDRRTEDPADFYVTETMREQLEVGEAPLEIQTL